MGRLVYFISQVRINGALAGPHEQEGVDLESWLWFLGP